jgi:hypothetical protein
MNQGASDQKPGERKKQAHPENTGGFIKAKTLWSEWQHMGSEHNQNTDSAPTIEHRQPR